MGVYHEAIMSDNDIQTYLQVNDILENRLNFQIFDPKITEDIYHLLDEERKNNNSKKIINDVIFNRRLMSQRFL